MSPAEQMCKDEDNYNSKRWRELQKIIIDAGFGKELKELFEIDRNPTKYYLNAKGIKI